MSPIYGQLSDKPLLAFVYSHGVRDMKHNRDEKLNAEHLLAVQRAAGLHAEIRVPQCDKPPRHLAWTWRCGENRRRSWSDCHKVQATLMLVNLLPRHRHQSRAVNASSRQVIMAILPRGVR